MVTDKEESDPESGEGLEDEDGRGLLIFLLDQGDRVEDECFRAVDGWTKSQYLSGKSHRTPQRVTLFDLTSELIVEMGLRIEFDLVDGAEIFREVLHESGQLDGILVTFSRQGVCCRKRTSEASTF